MMRILVTGATGFIGSALCPKLAEHGHEVHKLLRYVSGRFNFYDTEKHVFADLRDPDAVLLAVEKVRPEVIIHLGAQSAVSYSFGHPIEVMETNLRGTQAVANAALKVNAVLIYASTSEVYGAAKRFPIPEDEPLSATSPYSASKIAAEEYLRMLQKISGLEAVIARPFNTYGRANVRNRHFVVERAITQALEIGHINLHDPRPERDFLFREDHIDGYISIVKNLQKAIGQTINIATGDCWTIERMVRTVADIVGVLKSRTVSYEFSTAPDRPLDIPKLQGDNTKAKELLGWSPLWSLEDGLRKAIEEWMQVVGK